MHAPTRGGEGHTTTGFSIPVSVPFSKLPETWKAQNTGTPPELLVEKSAPQVDTTSFDCIEIGSFQSHYFPHSLSFLS